MQSFQTLRTAMAAVLVMSLFYGLMLRPNSRIFRCALIDGELLEAANTWDFSHRNRFVHVCTCLYNIPNVHLYCTVFQ